MQGEATPYGEPKGSGNPVYTLPRNPLIRNGRISPRLQGKPNEISAGHLPRNHGVGGSSPPSRQYFQVVTRRRPEPFTGRFGAARFGRRHRPNPGAESAALLLVEMERPPRFRRLGVSCLVWKRREQGVACELVALLGLFALCRGVGFNLADRGAGRFRVRPGRAADDRSRVACARVVPSPAG